MKRMIAKLDSWYGKRVVRGFFVVTTLLLVTGIAFGALGGNGEEEAQNETPREIVAGPAGSFQNASGISYIGTVEALNEARLESEVSGRITSVRVGLGEKVSQGTVIAEIENARERAQVLQAQGAYEAALANAEQSNVSLLDAESSLSAARQSGIDTYRGAYVIAEDAIYNLVDELISNPFSQIPGIRIDSRGDGERLGEERVVIETLLNDWEEHVVNPSLPEGDARTLLNEARLDMFVIATYVDEFAELVARQDINSEFSETTLSSLKTRFFTTRQTIQNTIASIQSDRNAIQNAEELVQQATLGSTSTEVSAANASVKQALGSLQIAQAALAQKIITAPITGFVNTLDVRPGDFVGARSPIAMITNTEAVEITAFIDDEDRERFPLNQDVRINEDVRGVVRAISPSINPNTGKVEIRIISDSSNIKSGDTVRITPNAESNEISDEDAPLIVPITAIKFDVDGTYVFTIDGESRLTKEPVGLGDTQSDQVVITSGIDASTIIVADARGLRDGLLVTISE